jgi:sortase (surface protein transpeptidase)
MTGHDTECLGEGTRTPLVRADHAPAAVAMAARPWRKWWVLTVALLFIGTGCGVLGLRDHQHPLAGPVKTQRVPKAPVAKSPTEPAKANSSPLIAPRSTPTELQIPAIGLAVSLSTLGLSPDGTVQVPTDIQQPGWFRLGPSPGQIGSAVILGHVDSDQGPAVFFKLRSLVAGDLITVNLADGNTAQFKVTSVAMYLKSNFPDQAVYGSRGVSELQLVTCAGAFDTQTGHYLSNIVVYSSLVSTVPKADVLPS